MTSEGYISYISLPFRLGGLGGYPHYSSSLRTRFFPPGVVALCELPRPQLYAADDDDDDDDDVADADDHDHDHDHDDDDDPSRSGQTMAFDRNYTVEIFEKFLAIIIIIL